MLGKRPCLESISTILENRYRDFLDLRRLRGWRGRKSTYHKQQAAANRLDYQVDCTFYLASFLAIDPTACSGAFKKQDGIKSLTNITDNKGIQRRKKRIWLSIKDEENLADLSTSYEAGACFSFVIRICINRQEKHKMTHTHTDMNVQDTETVVLAKMHGSP
jgi:hypothetical protein